MNRRILLRLSNMKSLKLQTVKRKHEHKLLKPVIKGKSKRMSKILVKRSLKSSMNTYN